MLVADKAPRAWGQPAPSHPRGGFSPFSSSGWWKELPSGGASWRAPGSSGRGALSLQPGQPKRQEFCLPAVEPGREEREGACGRGTEGVTTERNPEAVPRRL